jgi:hypothetical protein
MRRIEKEYVEAYTAYVEAFDGAMETIKKFRETKALANHLTVSLAVCFCELLSAEGAERACIHRAARPVRPAVESNWRTI